MAVLTASNGERIPFVFLSLDFLLKIIPKVFFIMCGKKRNWNNLLPIVKYNPVKRIVTISGSPHKNAEKLSNIFSKKDLPPHDD